MPKFLNITTLLKEKAHEIGWVVPFDLNQPDVAVLDFTANNHLLVNQPLENTRQFENVVNQMLVNQQANIGIGGYLENRVIYRRSKLFADSSLDRTLHLGVDIWAPAGTPVLAPLEGIVHSFRDNAQFGDYGPTIILQHQSSSVKFYTLYGHLNPHSLQNLSIGQIINRGQEFAAIGSYPENGDWPPHLHFQLITDMLGYSGDFPGVCSLNEKEFYKKICLDPNLMLKCQKLTAI